MTDEFHNRTDIATCADCRFDFARGIRSAAIWRAESSILEKLRMNSVVFRERNSDLFSIVC